MREGYKFKIANVEVLTLSGSRGGDPVPNPLEEEERPRLKDILLKWRRREKELESVTCVWGFHFSELTLASDELVGVKLRLYE